VKPLLRCFAIFMRQIARDSMLYAVCLAPVLAALAFKFGVPYTEAELCGVLGRASILRDYYLLFDLFLAVLTPYMFGFASSMVVLTEYDENMTGYMAVTPVGKTGYLVSRLAFPAAVSFAASVILLSTASLTGPGPLYIVLLSLLGSVQSVAVSLLLVSLSHNRVEGMALAKLSGVMLLGLPVPFFVLSGMQYLFSPLPSFWIAKMAQDESLLLLIPALVTSVLWIAVLTGRFKKKLT
jgi:fluoroquinolone transport system permease protein